MRVGDSVEIVSWGNRSSGWRAAVARVGICVGVYRQLREISLDLILVLIVTTSVADI